MFRKLFKKYVHKSGSVIKKQLNWVLRAKSEKIKTLEQGERYVQSQQ